MVDRRERRFSIRRKCGSYWDVSLHRLGAVWILGLSVPTGQSETAGPWHLKDRWPDLSDYITKESQLIQIITTELQRTNDPERWLKALEIGATKLPIISPHFPGIRLASLSQHLTGMRFGLERRPSCQPKRLAQTPHPEALGSALTHPHITTDYSEALLEFVTGTHGSPQAAIQELEELHARKLCTWKRTYLAIINAVSSARIRLPYPLAYYGESHIGRLKTVYRRGLGFRYGRQMQTIAGVHFNLSFSDEFWCWKAALDGRRDGVDSR